MRRRRLRWGHCLRPQLDGFPSPTLDSQSKDMWSRTKRQRDCYVMNLEEELATSGVYLNTRVAGKQAFLPTFDVVLARGRFSYN